MRHEEKIREELAKYGLEPQDLTPEELEEFDNAIETEENGGFVLDGVRTTFHEKAFRKNRPVQ